MAAIDALLVREWVAELVAGGLSAKRARKLTRSCRRSWRVRGWQSTFVPDRFKPAIGAANEAITRLGQHGRPDLLPEDLRLYDLRHTAASLITRQGASVKAVQKQLGHATASITLDTYGHLFPDELDALADALAALARTQRGPAVVPIREGAGG